MKGESWTSEGIAERMKELEGDEKVSEYLQLGVTLGFRQARAKKKMGTVESIAWVLIGLGIIAVMAAVVIWLL